MGRVVILSDGSRLRHLSYVILGNVKIKPKLMPKKLYTKTCFENRIILSEIPQRNVISK